MKQIGLLSQYNARWTAPADVAKTFVPISKFQELVHPTHSVLLGPRGSGKTTLLKMLTKPAITYWDQYRRKEFEQNPFEYPEFETIYIPSDIRWLHEIKSLGSEKEMDKRRAELVQRAIISSAVLIQMAEAAPELVDLSSDDESALSKALIDHWHLTGCISRLSSIRSSMKLLSAEIRGAVRLAGPENIDAALSRVPPSFLGHMLDVPIQCCDIIRDLFSSQLKYGIWALCFDELELAPEWLQVELLESIRSIDQSFILKLTCSPLLPSGLRSAPEPRDDFTPIRLWHSHVLPDASAFCENLTANFLKTKFPESIVSPDQFFSYSAMAIDDESEQDLRSYERDTTFYRQMKLCAELDESFRLLLRKRNINPDDPYTDNIELRNTFFRKIKPIVILRTTFAKEGQIKRSRKKVTVYAGKQAVYLMSEANPRWLQGLLSDMYDRWKSNPSYSDEIPKIPYGAQAQVLNGAVSRLEAFLKSTASGVPSGEIVWQRSLYDLLGSLGKSFQAEIYAKKFPVDPIGSFEVDANTDEKVLSLVKKALEVGAIIFVGQSSVDIPRKIEGSRFRLTYMLAPLYQLPLRNYRKVSMNSLLTNRMSLKDQVDMFVKIQGHEK